MRTSRLLLLGWAAAGLVACDAVLGLGKYTEPNCAAEDGGPCSSDATTTDVVDGSMEAATDAGRDAQPAPDADSGAEADAAPLSDVSIDVPVELLWAAWPMPNPDAAIASDSATQLPNPMSYSAVIEAGDAASDAEIEAEAGSDASDAASQFVTDNVTNLVWERVGSATTGLGSALAHCASVGMRLPTRIELVSLIDFTQDPTIDNAVFGGPPGLYWTSSVYPTDGGAAQSWFVKFDDGSVSYKPSDSTPASVRCVSGGGT
jgi:hypothetical protein